MYSGYFHACRSFVVPFIPIQEVNDEKKVASFFCKPTLDAICRRQDMPTTNDG
jgi:hypothetical protein